VALSGDTVGISRAHCRAWVDGELAFVEDQSSYGTFVNGERVTTRTRLHPGDRLRLGTPGIELVVVAEAGS
jgi:pSer/pThr/pTyr-binding forkhead associated (FHA) protein